MKRGVCKPLLPMERNETVRTDYYAGTAEQLTAADLVSVEHLPGSPGMPKTRVFITADRRVVDRRSWERDHETTAGSVTVLRTSINRYLVHVQVGRQECERRASELEASRDQSRRQAAFDQLAHEVRDYNAQQGPRTEGAFRDASLSCLESRLSFVLNLFTEAGGEMRYVLDAEDRASLAEAFEAVRELARSAKVVRDTKLANEYAMVRRAAVARNDPAFQCMLESLFKQVQ